MLSATVRRGLELAFWLALALSAYVLSFEFADEPGTYRWGAASWPRAVILFMALFALAQFLLERRADTETVQRHLEIGSEQLTLLSTFLLPLLYLFLLPRIGFYLLTPFFLLAFLWLVGERRWPVLILVSLLIYGFINLIFTRLFYVALPTGVWPGCYEFSNWFLVTVRS